MAVCWDILRGQQIYTVIQTIYSLLYIVAKCNFFSVVTWKYIITYLQKFEGCTHFCEILYIIYYYICLPLCTHTGLLYFDAAKKINKISFYWYRLFHCFCCWTTELIWNSNWNAAHQDYIKTTKTTALPSKILIWTRILIIEPSSDEIKYT